MELPTMPPNPSRDIEDNKDIAALSYAWVLAVFVFFWKKDSPFVRFHARQALVLFVLSLLFWNIPIVGRVLELVILAYCAIGFLNAASGKQKILPIAGDIAFGQWRQLRSSWKEIIRGVSCFWHHATASEHKDQIPPIPPLPPIPPVL